MKAQQELECAHIQFGQRQWCATDGPSTPEHSCAGRFGFDEGSTIQKIHLDAVGHPFLYRNIHLLSVAFAFGVEPITA